MKAAYHLEFKASLEAALRHYEGIGRPLADRFKSEVKAGVNTVLSGMVDHAPGPHGFRCYRCRKFPYLVYYERHEQTTLFLAVIYSGRAPGLLSGTLAGYRR